MKGLLEITCQAADVKVVPVDNVRVIRVYDAVSGIVVNIPLTALALATLVAEAVAA